MSSPNTYFDLPSSGTGLQLVDNTVAFPYPVPNNGGTLEYKLTYTQVKTSYSDAAIGSTDANAPSAYLTEKGPLVNKAGVVTFDRIFTQIPTAWNEKEQVAYTFPGRSFGTGVNWNPYGFATPISLYAIASVAHTFTQGLVAPTPDTTFIVTDNGAAVDYIGATNPNLASNTGSTNPSIYPSTFVVSSEVRLWRGTIWEKITKTVPAP